MANQIRFKQNTAAAAAASNPVLAAGEPGFEVDSGKFGIGNGVTPWNELPKIGNDKFLGTYLTLAALTAAHPAPAEGSEAHINEVGAVQVQKAIWDSEDNEWVIVGSVAPVGTGVLEYQTPITAASTTFNGTQKGLNKVYVFNSAAAQTVTINADDYVANDVINIERRGAGTVEIVQGASVRFRGVRDVNNRFFVNDSSSIVALLCRGSNEFTAIGNLKRGYTGAVTTSFYGAIGPAETLDVNVAGTGFSANMLVSISGNATLNSWTYTSNTAIVLNITTSGTAGDFITVTYDNGQIFEDTNAIEMTVPVTTAVVIETTSTSATWSPSSVAKTGSILRWTVSGGTTGIYDANDPTIDLSGNSGTAIITITSDDDLAGWTSCRFSTLSITSMDIGDAVSLTNLWIIVNPNLSSLVGLSNLINLVELRLFSNTALGGVLDLKPLVNLTDCSYLYLNSFTSIDVTGRSNITNLSCYTNQLTSIIGLADLVNLTTLNCNTNPSLGNIDFSSNTALTSLSCSTNGRTVLDITALTSLQVLTATSNAITTINVSNNVSLRTINVALCSLTVSAINNILLDRFANGLISGTRNISYQTQSPAANPTRTENTTDDVLDAYNALVAGGWTINGLAPA